MSILTAKILSNKLDVNERTARRYIKEMKEHYKPLSNRLTIEHYNEYWAIPQSNTDNIGQ